MFTFLKTRFGLIQKTGNDYVVSGMAPRIARTTTSMHNYWKCPHLSSKLCLRQRTEVGHQTGDPSQTEQCGRCCSQASCWTLLTWSCLIVTTAVCETLQV